jgi:hypothetical protein
MEDILLEIRCMGWSPEAVGLLSRQPAVEVAEDMADAGRDVGRSCRKERRKHAAWSINKLASRGATGSKHTEAWRSLTGVSGPTSLGVLQRPPKPRGRRLSPTEIPDTALRLRPRGLGVLDFPPNAQIGKRKGFRRFFLLQGSTNSLS